MRALRLILVGVASLGIPACGMIAGVDSYQTDLTASFDATTLSPTSTVDGASIAPPIDATQQPSFDATSVDSYIVDAYDEPPPPPPALDAAALSDGCPPSAELNASCGENQTCCTDQCSERRNCVSSCKAMAAPCSQDQCCVGSYCPYYDQGASCQPCLGEGASVPIVNFSTFKQACCSGAVIYTPGPICTKPD